MGHKCDPVTKLSFISSKGITSRTSVRCEKNNENQAAGNVTPVLIQVKDCEDSDV